MDTTMICYPESVGDNVPVQPGDIVVGTFGDSPDVGEVRHIDQETGRLCVEWKNDGVIEYDSVEALFGLAELEVFEEDNVVGALESYHRRLDEVLPESLRVEIYSSVVARAEEPVMGTVTDRFNDGKIEITWPDDHDSETLESFRRVYEVLEVFPKDQYTEARQRWEALVSEDVDENGECKHRRVEIVATQGFSGPVVDSYDDQDPRAHGGVTEIHRCARCGQTRRVNINGRWVEAGEWTSAIDESY